MKKAWLNRIIVILILVGIVFLITSTDKEITPVNNATDSDYCTSDSDCVPASCCHPNSCVAKEQAPVCKKIMCSQVCELGTLDCMQGSCICENNQCKAVLK